MRWRAWHLGVLRPKSNAQPDVGVIEKIVRPRIQLLETCKTNIKVEILAADACNKVYVMTSECLAAGTKKQLIFRVAFPIDPFYKVECEVAITEYVRLSTSIKVVVIYAFDSSSNNAIGFEWMLMENMEGRSLHRAWDTSSLDAKARMTGDVAGRVDGLFKMIFTKLRGIYMRSTDHTLEFYLGRSGHTKF